MLLLLTLLTTFFLAAPASTTTAASSDLMSRSSYTFELDSHFKKTGKTLTLTPEFACSDSNFCK